jgi:hypothetical protein
LKSPFSSPSAKLPASTTIVATSACRSTHDARKFTPKQPPGLGARTARRVGCPVLRRRQRAASGSSPQLTQLTGPSGGEAIRN